MNINVEMARKSRLFGGFGFLGGSLNIGSGK